MNVGYRQNKPARSINSICSTDLASLRKKNQSNFRMGHRKTFTLNSHCGCRDMPTNILLFLLIWKTHSAGSFRLASWWRTHDETRMQIIGCSISPCKPTPAGFPYAWYKRWLGSRPTYTDTKTKPSFTWKDSRYFAPSPVERAQKLIFGGEPSWAAGEWTNWRHTSWSTPLFTNTTTRVGHFNLPMITFVH